MTDGASQGNTSIRVFCMMPVAGGHAKLARFRRAGRRVADQEGNSEHCRIQSKYDLGVDLSDKQVSTVATVQLTELPSFQ